MPMVIKMLLSIEPVIFIYTPAETEGEREWLVSYYNVYL